MNKIIFYTLLLFIIRYFYSKYNLHIVKTDYDEKVKLLNNHIIYSNKPNIWILVPNDINSRKWESFGSRTSKKLNVPVMGMTILDNMQYQDESFVPTLHLKDGDLIETDEYTIEAVHTPGHASNHLCYLIKEVNCLITGDHIMQGSTVVIAPPDGDMRDYLLSLKKLKNYKIDFLAPGHGEFIERPFETVDWIVNHRLERETKVINKLQEKGKISLEDLVLSVYDDVDPRLHRIALASLEAHLLKLEHDRVVELDGNLWRCIN